MLVFPRILELQFVPPPKCLNSGNFISPRIVRILQIDEIMSLSHVPMSHPLVERLIGSSRRELLDHTLLWTATDLENKLHEYQSYYNEFRSHSGRYGAAPVSPENAKVIDINGYRWQTQCRDLFHQGQVHRSALNNLCSDTCQCRLIPRTDGISRRQFA